MYGRQICESLVNITSVCWPGPTGSKHEGDNGDRVCAYMADEAACTANNADNVWTEAAAAYCGEAAADDAAANND